MTDTASSIRRDTLEEARAQFVDWLIGIRDHTDNEIEYDLLTSLISSVENQEYLPA